MRIHCMFIDILFRSVPEFLIDDEWSGDGLMLASRKPLSEPMMATIYKYHSIIMVSLSQNILVHHTVSFINNNSSVACRTLVLYVIRIFDICSIKNNQWVLIMCIKRNGYQFVITSMVKQKYKYFDLMAGLWHWLSHCGLVLTPYGVRNFGSILVQGMACHLVDGHV